MAVVVVGGQGRKVGKTSVMTGLIAAMPEMRWTAMKITQHAHGSGERVMEEFERNGTDTGRYLAAGAARSFWVRAERLEEAMPRIAEVIAAAENVMIESNNVLEFLQPDCFLFVMDERVAEFKVSATRFIGRADALVVVDGRTVDETAEMVVRFTASAEQWCSEELMMFVTSMISGRCG